MFKPPRKMGIPRCTCETLGNSHVIDPDFDSEGNCNYHDRSSPESITIIESTLWNPDVDPSL